MLNIVGHKKIWFTISIILVGIALVSIAVWHFQESAQFTGGTLWEFSAAADNPPLASVQSFFASNLNLPDAQVSYDAQHQIFLATFAAIDEPTPQADLSLLKAQWPSFDELSFQSISPSVGASVRN